jgi:hypothetical protein
LKQKVEDMTRTEKTKRRAARRYLWRPSHSMWWMLVTEGNLGREVLTADCNGERVLPVFSGEAEAELFAWVGGMFEDGWRVRKTPTDELVSVLRGTCSRVSGVALDPVPEMIETDAIALVIVARESFLGWVAGGQRPFSRDRAHVIVLKGG